MAQAKKIRGKNFLIFVDGKALALTTETTLALTGETQDGTTKDDGIWQAQDIAAMSWQAQNSSFYSADKDYTAGVVGAKLMELMLAAEPVDIVVGVPTNASNGEVPEAGWTQPEEGTYGTFSGKGVITELQLTGNVGEMAQCSMTVEGYGQLVFDNGAA